MAAHMPLMRDCLPSLLNLSTGHNTGMHTTSLWLAFLTNVRQGRTLLWSTQQLEFVLQCLLEVC